MSESSGRADADDRPGWTPGRSVVFLLLLLDITVVAGWLFVYSSEYDRVAKVVGGVWGAVMAFLAAVGWKSRGTSLPELVGLLPVRLVTAAYTLLIMGALPLWVLWQFPVHRVQVAGSGVPEAARWTVVVTRADDTVHVHRGGATWSFQARPGPHTLEAVAEGYAPFAESLPVRWLARSDHVELAGMRELTGRLELAFDRDMTWEVYEAGGTVPARSGAATLPGPLPLELPAGTYLVRARAAGASPDSVIVTVVAGATLQGELHFRRSDARGTLTVRSEPAGAELLLDGERVGTTPWTGRLTPGSYRIVARRVSPANPRFAQFFRGSAEVRASRETLLEPTLETIDLPALRILASAPGGATYHLDQADAEHALGVVEASSVFHVFPGSYRVLRSLGGTVTECGPVSLRAGQEVSIRC